MAIKATIRQIGEIWTHFREKGLRETLQWFHSKDAPVVVQAVQHVVYPTYTLPEWPDGTPHTQLVGITHGMSDALFSSSVESLRSLVSRGAS